VTCKSFEGRSTGQAIALATDSMIAQVNLPSGTIKTMTTDAASNMIKGMKDSNEIDNHLLCLDHIINTCINKSLEVNGIKELVEKVCIINVILKF